MRYATVTSGSVNEFDRRCEKMLEAGWSLVGGVSASSVVSSGQRTYLFAQAFTKPDDTPVQSK